MASRSPKANGRAHGAVNGRRPALDARMVATQAEQVTASAIAIARITDDVSNGAETQIRSLDGTMSSLNEMAESLKETASQADSVGASSEELMSSVNEMAASAHSGKAARRFSSNCSRCSVTGTSTWLGNRTT